MSALSRVRQSIKMNEASTKRGVVAVITGASTLYLIFKGQPVDVDTLTTVIAGKVDFWMGIGLTVMGLIGVFLPDEPKTVQIQLPPIDPVGESQAVRADGDHHRHVGDSHPHPDHLRQSVPPVDYVRGNTSEAADRPGFNG